MLYEGEAGVFTLLAMDGKMSLNSIVAGSQFQEFTDPTGQHVNVVNSTT